MSRAKTKCRGEQKSVEETKKKNVDGDKKVWKGKTTCRRGDKNNERGNHQIIEMKTCRKGKNNVEGGKCRRGGCVDGGGGWSALIPSSQRARTHMHTLTGTDSGGAVRWKR